MADYPPVFVRLNHSKTRLWRGDFLQMTKNVAMITALLTVACSILCCCSATYVERDVISQAPTYYDIYVSGAVENDGCFSLIAGSDYATLYDCAGVIDGVSALPDNLSGFITSYNLEVIVDYTEGNAVYNSVNVNGALIIARIPIPNVEYRVVNKLADFLESNGTITNRDILRQALGDDYEDNYYKFFISRQDYA